MLTRSFVTILLSFSVAISGILYELVFAHFLSVLLGGTLFQYSITIGLFTFALGLSCLFYPLFPHKYKSISFLVKLQFVISVFALCSGIALNLLLSAQNSELFSPSIYYISYVPVIIIGLLTGLELPILMEGAHDAQRALILSADYAGMFFGTLAFPIFLLPNLGVNFSLGVAIGMNLAAAFFTLPLRELK